jgi:hypothetical protein
VGEVLSLHLDGKPCAVGCEFCYLGQRADQPSQLAGQLAGEPGVLLPSLLEEALGRLEFQEVAVALSEPSEAALLGPIRRAAGKRRLSVTTTMQIARSVVLDVDRVSLSVDPRKGRISLPAIARLAQRLCERGAEVVLIVSLVTPQFAERLFDGLLSSLLELPEVDKLALNALKPPPPWCGRTFWMKALARIRPLLEKHLDRKLFLDCWVAARLLGLGGCPARADLTPAGAGLAFRGCVYSPQPDFVAASADELASRLVGFTPPPVCPFPIP